VQGQWQRWQQPGISDSATYHYEHTRRNHDTLSSLSEMPTPGWWLGADRRSARSTVSRPSTTLGIS